MNKSFFTENINFFSFFLVFSSMLLLLTGRILYSNAYYIVLSLIFLTGFAVNYSYLKGLGEDLSHAF